MVVLNVTVNECTPQTIVLGRRGTYNTEEITFDVSYLVETYGEGTAVLAIKRSQDTSAYPAVVTQDGNILTWGVSDVDTYYVGAGECQLMWYVDNGLAKTIIYPMVVMRDILQTSEEAPDAYQTWVDTLTELGAETLQNAKDAAQSAEDAETAKGEAVQAKDDAEAAAKRAEDAAERFVDVSASANTLEPSEPATAEYDEGHFTFGIPKGEKGDKLTYSDLTEADKADLVQGPIKTARDAAVLAINTAGDTQTERVNTAGTNQTSDVNQAGATQVENVNQAGTTQVSNVNQAGTTQVQAVDNKGAEVLASIPADYTDLSDEVDTLKTALTYFDDIPGTVQTVNFDTDGNPSSIVHTSNGAAVRTDTFTWGTNTVTEKRELADGSYITFVTDLTTLVTTISEIQEA